MGPMNVVGPMKKVGQRTGSRAGKGNKVYGVHRELCCPVACAPRELGR